MATRSYSYILLPQSEILGPDSLSGILESLRNFEISKGISNSLMKSWNLHQNLGIFTRISESFTEPQGI